MIWVGGGIIVHGLETYGLDGPAHLIHDAAEAAAHAVPVLPGLVGWLVGAAGSGVVGLARRPRPDPGRRPRLRPGRPLAGRAPPREAAVAGVPRRP